MFNPKSTSSIALAFLFLGLLSTAAKAENPNEVEAKTEETSDIIFQPRIGVGYTTTSNEGIKDFTSFDGFLPLMQKPGKNITFLQGKMLLNTENSALGGNLLLGHRFTNRDRNSVIGGYVSYDARNTGNAVFNQIGTGLELLTKNWELRANGYIPVGTTRSTIAESFPGSSAFSGNSLQLDRVRLVEQSLFGVDLEVGKKLSAWEKGELRGYIGSYLYSGDGIGSFVGAKSRVVAHLDNFQTELALQSDGYFGTNLTLNVGLSLGGNSRKSQRNHVLARMGDNTERQSTIYVDSRNIKDQVAAIDSQTGKAFSIIHVAPGGNSNGSYESPYSTVDQAIAIAKPGDIIYVRADSNSFISSFSVPDGVSVLSNAPKQYLNTKQAGNVLLPFSGTGVQPVVKGTFAPGQLENGQGVVTLGSNSVLSGFDVRVDDAGTNPTTGGGRRGIQAKDVSNVSILNNTVTNAFGEGIYLENVTGEALIDNNVVIGTRNNSDSTSGSNFTEYNGSIFAVNSKGTIDLTISNNRVEMASGATGYDVDGIEINLCRDFNGESPNPFAACSTAASGTYNIFNNVVNGNGAVGGAEGIDTNVGSNGTATFVIRDNNLQKMPDNGITLDINKNAAGTSTGKATLLIESNIINGVNRDGIDLDVQGASQTSAIIRNNQLTGVTQRGFDIETIEAAELQLTIEGNQITNTTPVNNSSDVARFRIGNNSGSTSNVNAVIRDNTSTTDALSINANNNSQLCLQAENNQLTGNSTFNRATGATVQVENTLSTNTPAITAPSGSTIVTRGTCGLP
jgi:trimeric autotransporter adhesin